MVQIFISFIAGDERVYYSENNYKVVCESPKFHGYINCDPKREYLNADGIKIIDNALFELTGLRIKSISIIKSRGLAEFIYKRPASIPLANDSKWITAYKLKRDRTTLMYACMPEFDDGDNFLKKLVFFLKKYFDLNEGIGLYYQYNLECHSGEPTSNSDFKKLLKHHGSYNCCGNCKIATKTANTPIEQIFREELKKRSIPFEEQVDFVIEGRKFTKPDFILREHRILVYCDGAAYHNNPEKIAMDKQQDRWLQIYGYFPCRFTGSEIHANVQNCVSQLEALIHRVRKE